MRHNADVSQRWFHTKRKRPKLAGQSLLDRGEAYDVIELLASLGIKARVLEADATLGGRYIGKKYRVNFTAFSDMPVFRLERKVSRLAPRKNDNVRSDFVRIVSITPCDSVPVRCIQVDSRNHLYLAGATMIPTHNTTIAMDLADASRKSGEPVLYVQLEELTQQYADRYFSTHTNITKNDIRDLNISPEQIREMRNFAKSLKDSGKDHLYLQDDLFVLDAILQEAGRPR